MPGLKRSDELEKHGTLCSFGQLEDRDGVGQRAGHRLVDEHRLARLEHRHDLLQVRPAVHALQQHDVDLRRAARRSSRRSRRRTCSRSCLGEALDAVAAGGDVGAAAGEGGHDADAGQVALGLGVVEQLGEGDDVRGVQADDADPERLRSPGAGLRRGRRAEQRQRAAGEDGAAVAAWWVLRGGNRMLVARSTGAIIARPAGMHAIRPRRGRVLARMPPCFVARVCCLLVLPARRRAPVGRAGLEGRRRQGRHHAGRSRCGCPATRPDQAGRGQAARPVGQGARPGRPGRARARCW